MSAALESGAGTGAVAKNRLPSLSAMVSFTLIATESGRTDPPCVPDGGSVSVDFANPELASDEKIIGGDAMEDDVFFDDKIGAAQTDPQSGSAGGKTSFLIQNKGGKLSYGGTSDGQNQGNDDALNGGLEGDCIEVYIRWTIRQEVLETTTNSTSGDVFVGISVGSKGGSKGGSNGGGCSIGAGGSFGGSTTTTERKKVLVWHQDSGKQEVCPCDE